MISSIPSSRSSSSDRHSMPYINRIHDPKHHLVTYRWMLVSLSQYKRHFNPLRFPDGGNIAEYPIILACKASPTPF